MLADFLPRTADFLPRKWGKLLKVGESFARNRRTVEQ
jgi:hypothetical protein